MVLDSSTIEDETKFVLRNEDSKGTSGKIRYLCIDVFRGIAIVSMIFVNVIAPFNRVPSWSKHAVDFGLTYVDLVAPFFMFAIGLTYKMSFERYYKKQGKLQTYIRFVRRYAAFFGMGIIGSRYIFTLEGVKFSWGVLQAIGIAGIFTLFFMKFPRIIRFILGFSLLAVYQYILTIPIEIEGTIVILGDLSWYDEHGGVIGGIGFCIMMLLSTTIIDDFRKTNKWQILGIGGVFTVLGTTLHFIWKVTDWPLYGGISKERVTAAYILLTVGLGAVLFWLLWYIYDVKHLTKDRSLLQPIGRNAFFIYITHPILIGLTILILSDNAHFALVMFFGILSVVLLWLLSFFMDRKKIYIVI
ncbi:MAG: DUF1624 domain-containing protein [Candidatus Heimdallarchaeota archaeon]|nr:DUF1624 domain-containing protein [Candidatus Heimdallarchaeota archaeon]MCK4954039.1 DUF1624 domain-containing protein [Candidatus Heimdallarchaeota archaeon]